MGLLIAAQIGAPKSLREPLRSRVAQQRCPKGHRRPVLDQDDGAALIQIVLAGPDLARHGRSEWTLPSLAEEIAQRWGKSLHPASLSRVLRRLGLSKQKSRPRHPQADPEAQKAFKKRASPRPRWSPPRSEPRTVRAQPPSRLHASRVRCGRSTGSSVHPRRTSQAERGRYDREQGPGGGNQGDDCESDANPADEE